MSIFTPQNEQYMREWAVGKTAGVAPTDFGENAASAWDLFRSAEVTGANRDNLRDLYQKRIDTVNSLTGVKLVNPYGADPSWMHDDLVEDINPDTLSPIDRAAWEANRAFPNPIKALYDLFDQHDGSLNEYQRIQKHEQDIANLIEMLPPAEKGMVASREALQEKMKARARFLEGVNADIGSRATLTGALGQFAGAAGATMLQPEMLATLPIGAPARVGLLTRVLIEASIGAGTQAMIEPEIQRQRGELGLEAGFGRGVEDILTAGAGGAILGGGAHVLGTILRGGARAFQKVFGRAPTPEEHAAIDLARQSVNAETATPYQERTAAAAQTYYANEQAATMAALEGRVIEPTEILKPEDVTQRYVHQGAALRVLTNSDLGNIEVDAELMQFKSGGDKAGVTDRLQGVSKWEPERAGVSLVYEYADGKMIIADGHQRLALAQRLAAQGQQIEMPVIMLREIDGVTPAEARARAAFKNIAEGTGTASDAAKILRDMGATAADLDLPPLSALVRDAEGLARLNDDVFGMVINGVLPDRFAAIIGRYVNDPDLQTGIAKLLAKLQPANVQEAEQIVDQARHAGVSRGTQVDMFGEKDIAESLYLERARVLDRAQKMLRRNATTFRTLLDQENEIASAGNVLDQSSNAARLQADQQIMAYVRAQANRKGVISDALTEAARAAKESGSYQQPARDFLNTLTRAIEDGTGLGEARPRNRPDVEFAASRGAAVEGEDPSVVVPDDKTIAMFDEPAGDRAIAQTDRLDRELRDEVQASKDGLDQPTIGQPAAVQSLPFAARKDLVDGFKFEAPARTIEEMYTAAPADQAALATIGKTIGRRRGVRFENPGLKALDTTREKMARKGYTDTRELTDIVRSGFVVEEPGQAEGIVRTLAENFRVIDEGWNVTPEGYFDRKILIKFDDGMIGEVQIWHPDMLKIKNEAGWKLYQKMRKIADKTSPEYQALVAEQQRLYFGVAEKLPDSWRSVLDEFISGNGGAPGNVRANAPADMTVPELATSSRAAGTQDSPPVGTNQAADSVSSAGRQSQLTNVSGTGQPPVTEPGAEGLPQFLIPGVRIVSTADRLALEIDRPLLGGNTPMDMGLFGGDVNQLDLIDALRGPAGDLSKMEVPMGERIDERGVRVAETQTIQDVLDGLEADQEFVQQLDLCDRNAA